jgi:hypothetical protein
VIQEVNSKIKQFRSNKNALNNGIEKEHMKSVSCRISDTFKLPFIIGNNTPKDEDSPVTGKSLKVSVKQKEKKTGSIHIRFQAKITKIMKANLSNMKFLELNSKNQHQFCTDSQYNQTIRKFNDFIMLVNEKVESRDDVHLITEACRRLGMKINKNKYLSYYNSSDFIEEIKAKVLESFLNLINTQNNMRLDMGKTSEEFEQYSKRMNGFKAFIEKGNHGTIVKTVLNRRSWWSIQDTHDDNYESSDFIWTQWIK